MMFPDINEVRRHGQYFETLSPPLLGTQMFTPSKATPAGLDPVVNIPRSAPSDARILERVLLNAFATQMLLQSNATPSALAPVANVPKLAPSTARIFDTLPLRALVT